MGWPTPSSPAGMKVGTVFPGRAWPTGTSALTKSVLISLALNHLGRWPRTHSTLFKKCRHEGGARARSGTLSHWEASLAQPLKTVPRPLLTAPAAEPLRGSSHRPSGPCDVTSALSALLIPREGRRGLCSCCICLDIGQHCPLQSKRVLGRITAPSSTSVRQSDH